MQVTFQWVPILNFMNTCKSTISQSPCSFFYHFPKGPCFTLMGPFVFRQDSSAVTLDLSHQVPSKWRTSSNKEKKTFSCFY